MALHTRSVSRGLPAGSDPPESPRATWNVPREEGPHGDGQVGREVRHPRFRLQGRPFSASEWALLAGLGPSSPGAQRFPLSPEVILWRKPRSLLCILRAHYVVCLGRTAGQCSQRLYASASSGQAVSWGFCLSVVTAWAGLAGRALAWGCGRAARRSRHPAGGQEGKAALEMVCEGRPLCSPGAHAGSGPWSGPTARADHGGLTPQSSSLP